MISSGQKSNIFLGGGMLPDHLSRHATHALIAYLNPPFQNSRFTSLISRFVGPCSGRNSNVQTIDSQTRTRNTLWIEYFVLCQQSTCNGYETGWACYCHLYLSCVGANTTKLVLHEKWQRCYEEVSYLAKL